MYPPTSAASSVGSTTGNVSQAWAQLAQASTAVPGQVQQQLPLQPLLQQQPQQFPTQLLQPLPSQAVPAPAPAGAPVVEPSLVHAGADPYYRNISADELRWHTVQFIKGQPAGAALPEWASRRVAPQNSGSTADPSATTSGASNSSAPALPTATASTSVASPAGTEVLRHPDPSTSTEELRWQHHQQTRQAGGVQAAPGPIAAAAAPAGLGIAFGYGVSSGPSGLGAAGSLPQTPVFPTPVRTLFPPTPAAAPGVVDESAMDTSEAADSESAYFKSMYAETSNAMASPEEMRVVQAESHRMGRQVVPYWLAAAK